MKKRVIGLDVGDKTIGVAVSDPFGLTAQGITTIHRTNEDEDFKKVLSLAKKYDIEKFVVGFPKNMNNTVGPQGQKVLDFCKKLEKISNMEIVLEDERLTTVSAERILIAQDVSRKKRKEVIDKVAAVLILQSYLDRNGV